MDNNSAIDSSNTTPSENKYLIIGQGDIGLPVTNKMADKGLDITGMARSERGQYQLDDKAQFIQADAKQLSADQINSFTHIAIVVTPDNYDAENYQNTYLGIAQHIADLAQQLPQLKRVVFISSTGVYGQNTGEWIDETVEPAPPKREASTFIRQAEQVLQQAYGERAVIIRPSGIYGKQRLMRIRKSREQHKQPMPLNEWTNRIMDSDLINIIVKVLTLPESEALKPIYIATDYAPVTSYQLTCWLAEQLDSTQPPVDTSENQNKMSGKRLHSNIPRVWLRYPDWQSGYRYILQALTD